ncbi:unnamed protein product [Strongylus vulgaris]|uniref:Uncharacterized protein n=1 Tax=Strongylus vulgaris TaxID=40348 RepID=A0A3P7I2H7_STRVU|nr:unnamed protein product [Strongylus vulgaris]
MPTTVRPAFRTTLIDEVLTFEPPTGPPVFSTLMRITSTTPVTSISKLNDGEVKHKASKLRRKFGPMRGQKTRGELKRRIAGDFLEFEEQHKDGLSSLVIQAPAASSTILVFNCSGDVRKVEIHYSVPAENSAGSSVQRIRQPIWSVAFLEDVVLREGSIPEFSVSSVVCPSYHMTSPSMFVFRWIAKTRH